MATDSDDDDPDSNTENDSLTEKNDTIKKRPKKRRREEGDTSANYDDLIKVLKDQIENERKNSADLLQRLDNFQKTIDAMQKNIEEQNKLILNLQNENKMLSQNQQNSKTNKKMTKQNTGQSPLAQTISVIEKEKKTTTHTVTPTSVTDDKQHTQSEAHTQQSTQQPSIAANANTNEEKVETEQLNNMSTQSINSSLDDNADGTDIVYNESDKVKRTNKIPPIVVWTENRNATQNAIKEHIPKHSCVFNQINKSKFRIVPKDNTIREKVIEFLKTRGYHFNTYTPTNEKMISILLKGSEISDSELISDAIQKVGITPHKIQRYTTGFMRKNNIISDIWQIILLPGTDTKLLLGIKYIDSWSVRWEFMHKRSVLQCKRCQRFEHVANNCTLPYRCVKCLDAHNPYECPKNSANNTVKPRCVNCSGEHTANNAKLCPVFKKAIEISNFKKNKDRNHTNNAQQTKKKVNKVTTTSNATKNQPSYAEKLKKKVNAPNSTNNENTSSENSNDKYMKEMMKCMSENSRSMQETFKSVMAMQRDLMNLFAKQNA